MSAHLEIIKATKSYVSYLNMHKDSVLHGMICSNGSLL